MSQRRRIPHFETLGRIAHSRQRSAVNVLADSRQHAGGDDGRKLRHQHAAQLAPVIDPNAARGALGLVLIDDIFGQPVEFGRHIALRHKINPLRNNRQGCYHTTYTLSTIQCRQADTFCFCGIEPDVVPSQDRSFSVPSVGTSPDVNAPAGETHSRLPPAGAALPRTSRTSVAMAGLESSAVVNDHNSIVTGWLT